MSAPSSVSAVQGSKSGQGESRVSGEASGGAGDRRGPGAGRLTDLGEASGNLAAAMKNLEGMGRMKSRRERQPGWSSPLSDSNDGGEGEGTLEERKERRRLA
jgi:hypothetical protein